MLSVLGLFSFGVVDQLETPPWILFGVCVVGVFLAYITDEGYSSSLFAEAFSYKAVVSKPIVSHKETLKAGPYTEQKGGLDIGSAFSWSSLLLRAWEAARELLLPSCSIVEAADAQIRRWMRQWDLYRATLSLRRLATSKRHFFYLLEKKTLNLPIRPGESEVDSYLDCKRHVGSSWPFMWEVASVRDPQISCSGYKCVPMSSYSYLDLMRDDRVQTAAIEAAKKWATGNHGPRMLGGNMTILRDLERAIANFFGRDDTLLCAAGYLACMSACAAVATESTVIFADTRLHASLRAGLKLGEARVVWFKHNDFKDCERLMQQYRSKYHDAWMVIESVYSMDGDICDLPAAHRLCVQYRANMILDEAHGLGVVGQTGRGVEEHFGLPGSATLIVGTFSKSIASIGGYITGPQRLIDYMDFHAPGNVFSAPLPAYCAGAALKSFEILVQEPELVTRAQHASRRLRELLRTGSDAWPPDYPDSKKYRLEGDPASTVIPVIFADDIDRVMRVATRLKESGYMCSAVAYPACSLRTPRFRITATAAYTEDLMGQFVQTLVRICVQEEPSDIAMSLSTV